MTSKTHASLVTDQFGSRAEAYLHSAVHAEGEDLQYLASVLKDHTAARVLDLGCGGGHVSFRVAPFVREVVAYDLSQQMLDVVARTAAERGLTNLSTALGSVDTISFPDASFDFVLSRFSAHHWHQFHEGLAEARRVLKPDGHAVFIDVVSPGPALLDTYLQSVEFLRDPSHIRDYSVDEWKTATVKAGFNVLDVKSLRLRLEFTSWVERMRTSDIHVKAIRSLQATIADDVSKHFAIEADGSFTIDTMILSLSAG